MLCGWHWSKQSEDVVQHERGWKLLLVFLFMLLFWPPQGGTISKDKLHDRFRSCARNEWFDVVGSIAMNKQQLHGGDERGEGDDAQKRAARFWECCRHGLEGEEVASDIGATSQQLKEES